MNTATRLTLAATLVLLIANVSLHAQPRSWPEAQWQTATPRQTGLDAAQLQTARDYALSGGGAGMISRGGKLVLAWGDVVERFDLKSTTKSIGLTALGLGILDGKMQLGDLAIRYQPRLGIPPDHNASKQAWIEQITLEHLATQTAGFEKPGGYTELLFEPGTHWAYSDGGPNWLAECVTLSYRQDLDQLLFDRVFTPLGIKRTDLVWRKHNYRDKLIEGIPRREFGSGFSGNVDAMARIGLLYLRGGLWREQRILPEDFVRRVSTTVPSVVGLPELDPMQFGNASEHYGLLWWNNADATLRDVPRDAYWSWGLYDSLIVVIPSLDIVATRAGQAWHRTANADHYDVLKPFISPIALAAQDDILERPSPSPVSLSLPTPKLEPPYPPSPVVAGIEWSPAESIVRRARGSDNWPITWGDDDLLYTAYGDGQGFEPPVDIKLSLGLARITGSADDFFGENIRSPTLETRGDDKRGKKASGLLMVDGVLYLWGRNADNSQLAWSSDHGKTWSWSDWKFTTSFGCPTFLNFGANYADARDDYVYIYSHDSDSAYVPADRMVLARVPEREIRNRSAYEFFVGMDRVGALWSSDIDARQAVFEHTGNCYRSGITFNAGLGRYLWCQTLPGSSVPPDTRFAGGFAIFDAPAPWGPWTTVQWNPSWDVGPGESGSIPTKWMSADGRTFHFVFSGDDHFSVRLGIFQLRSSN